MADHIEASNAVPPTEPVVPTMKALILKEPRQLAMEAVPIPTPGPGEVLVRVKAALTCGTDLKAYLRGHPQIPMPGVFGHEYSGVVVQTGPGAEFTPGDAVMGVHSAPCQDCAWCHAGQENLCESIMATKVLGAYAEYLLIPARVAAINLFHKPDWLSFDRAALLEPLACVAHGLEKLNLEPQHRVAIIGPGAIGLMFVASLRHMGLRRITLAGRNPDRLEIGRQMGAEAVQLSEIRGPFDVVIECTGKVEVWQSSLDLVRRGGTLMLFGGCPAGSKVSFDTSRLHYDEITVMSPFHFGTKAVRTARSWLLDPEFDLSPLISGERKLDQAENVFGDLEEGRGIKYVFRP
jgi:L-iditol 2-dehydrogenase